MSEDLIVCDRVSRVYRSTVGQESLAIDNVSLSIRTGEFVCLVGPSGCGKTTLLNIIAGFILPTGGTVRLRDKVIKRPGPDRGVVFQEYSLFGWLTVRGNVEFGLRMAGTPANERQRIATHYLRLVGLEAAAARYPFELSGGMKQRVAIARALVTNPEVLLMDEPFAALDAMTRSSLQSELLSIWETERKTVVFVTHNIAEALYLGDRLIVMSPGPGRIQDEVVVPLARPRRRTSPAFNELYERLEKSLGVQAGD